MPLGRIDAELGSIRALKPYSLKVTPTRRGRGGGDDRSNWQLSAERSVNTYREIVTVAPALRSLRNTRNEEIVSVSGYASTRPIDPNETREAWAKNRRIDLRFVMEVDSKQRLKQIINLTDSMKVEIDRLVTASGGRK